MIIKGAVPCSTGHVKTGDDAGDSSFVLIDIFCSNFNYHQ